MEKHMHFAADSRTEEGLKQDAPRQLLLDVKSLGFANRRHSLHDVARRAADIAQVPSPNDGQNGTALPWAARTQHLLKLAMVALLLGVTTLSLYQLSKAGWYSAALL